MEIFIVEDSPAVRERLEAMLSPLGHIAGHAAEADEAIRGILAKHPDVVVLDLKLARSGSGFDVLRAIHEVEPGIDVYMLTNFASEAYRRLAVRLGARELFDKSFEFERVRDLIAKRPGRASRS